MKHSTMNRLSAGLVLLASAAACEGGLTESDSGDQEPVANASQYILAPTGSLSLTRGAQRTAFTVSPADTDSPFDNIQSSEFKPKKAVKICDPVNLQVKADNLCESLVVELYASLEEAMGVDCWALCTASNVSYDSDCNVTAGHCECDVTCS